MGDDGGDRGRERVARASRYRGRTECCMKKRAGVLLHPTSLPGGPVGALGSAARSFVDLLADAGVGVWQMLPLGPSGFGGSPYMSSSAFAGNPLLVDIAPLVEAGWLQRSDLGDVDETKFDGDQVDLDYAEALMRRVLDAAFARFDVSDAAFVAFCERNAEWLDPFSEFAVRSAAAGGASWRTWTREGRPAARELDRVRFAQFAFAQQWAELKRYANERGVSLVGDVPIFVSYESADVWRHPELFQLDEGGAPAAVAGVPPDYFSPTGQRWGNPLYDWEALAATDYAWWVARFSAAFEMFDSVRVDHFRGFESYWRVPSDAETAVDGSWVRGPGRSVFDAVAAARGCAVDALPIFAEDLGIITREVEELRDALGLPGMRVLQFGFDGDGRNPHLPANVVERSVVYTGTHDNDTSAGWLASLDAAARARVADALGRTTVDARALVEAAWKTPASLAVAPLQDLLGLGTEARMNTPGTAVGNWTWRVRRETLEAFPKEWLRELGERTGRLAPNLRADVGAGDSAELVEPGL
ncbi:MAG: 4-alpha-glucanotransferase [Myxococcales bacterium]|nr:4-alpha-glucanotransferase [Myxococcales bacterium]